MQVMFIDNNDPNDLVWCAICSILQIEHKQHIHHQANQAMYQICTHFDAISISIIHTFGLYSFKINVMFIDNNDPNDLIWCAMCSICIIEHKQHITPSSKPSDVPSSWLLLWYFSNLFFFSTRILRISCRKKCCQMTTHKNRCI